MSTSAPGWYAVAGALGGAIVASIGNQFIARRQRKVDGERLDRQLAHDREMRDRDHVRAVLGPITGRLTSQDDFIQDLRDDISQVGEDRDHERRAKVLTHLGALHERVADMHQEAITLLLLLGVDAPIFVALGDAARALGAGGRATDPWLAGELDDDGVDRALVEASSKYDEAEVRFVKEARRLAA